MYVSLPICLFVETMSEASAVHLKSDQQCRIRAGNCPEPQSCKGICTRSWPRTESNPDPTETADRAGKKKGYLLFLLKNGFLYLCLMYLPCQLGGSLCWMRIKWILGSYVMSAVASWFLLWWVLLRKILQFWAVCESYNNTAFSNNTYLFACLILSFSI